ncbi:mannose-6-phosphate isomerase, class I [Vibrio sp. RC27]
MNTKVTPCFYLMDNVIQNYAWGSVDSIARLFDQPNPKNEPQAEIWMGAHPGGCSKVFVDEGKQLLSALIAENRSHFLSSASAERFDELPFLFKVLAANSALSIQVHPSKTEAEIGYARENELGIEFGAANRNYKDPNHKPELVYALTQYDALNGFREYADIIANFDAADLTSIKPLFEAFKNNQAETGLKDFFVSLLSLNGEDKTQAISELLTYATNNRNERLPALLLDLSQQYPGDIGLFAPMMLHYITLQPGEAMYLDARTPHAYLRGTGLEVMASSDNVLRAGLTPKHIDIEELSKCTSFAAKPASTLLVDAIEDQGEFNYPIPVDDFRFSIYPTASQTHIKVTSAEIIFAIDDSATLEHTNGETITIEKGQSVFIPAATEGYTLTSKARVARVYN